MPVLAVHRSETHRLLSGRLALEFSSFTLATVERCVADVQACMTHLGVDATPDAVERMAREHLVGMVKSRPPSEPPPGGVAVPPAGGRRMGAMGPDGPL